MDRILCLLKRTRSCFSTVRVILILIAALLASPGYGAQTILPTVAASPKPQGGVHVFCNWQGLISHTESDASGNFTRLEFLSNPHGGGGQSDEKTIASGIDINGRAMVVWIDGGKLYFTGQQAMVPPPQKTAGVPPVPTLAFQPVEQLFPDVVDAIAVDVAKNQDGRLEIFFLQREGKIRSAPQAPGKWTWGPIYTIGASSAAPILDFDVTPATDGRLFIVGVTAQRTVSITEQEMPNGAWYAAWYDLGGHDIQRIYATRTANSRLALVAVGADSRLYDRYRSEGRFDVNHRTNEYDFSAWGTVSDTARISGPIAIHYDVSGRFRIAARLIDDNNVHIFTQDPPNGDYSWLPPRLTDQPSGAGYPAAGLAFAEIASGVLYLFDVSRNGITAAYAAQFPPLTPSSVWTPWVVL